MSRVSPQGRWSALGDRGEGKCNLVYVGDLVRMIRFMIENDTGRFAVFNGNGPEVPTWNSYLERFNAALGFPPLAPPDPSLGLKVALRRPVRKVGKYLLANHRESSGRRRGAQPEDQVRDEEGGGGSAPAAGRRRDEPLRD